jgi:hypothetical protein
LAASHFITRPGTEPILEDLKRDPRLEVRLCATNASDLFLSARWDQTWAEALSIAAIVFFVAVLVCRMGGAEAERGVAGPPATTKAWRILEILALGYAILFFSLARFVNFSELARAEDDASQTCTRSALELRNLEQAPIRSAERVKQPNTLPRNSASISEPPVAKQRREIYEACHKAILLVNALRVSNVTVVSPFHSPDTPTKPDPGANPTNPSGTDSK